MFKHSCSTCLKPKIYPNIAVGVIIYLWYWLFYFIISIFFFLLSFFSICRFNTCSLPFTHRWQYFFSPHFIFLFAFFQFLFFVASGSEYMLIQIQYTISLLGNDKRPKNRMRMFSEWLWFREQIYINFLKYIFPQCCLQFTLISLECLFDIMNATQIQDHDDSFFPITIWICIFHGNSEMVTTDAWQEHVQNVIRD